MQNQHRQNISKATRKLFIWTLAWLIALAIASFGNALLWSDNKPLTLLGLVGCSAVGVGMLYANANYLKSLDELQAKLQIQAMGMTLGVGLLFATGLPLLNKLGVLSTSLNISALLVFMSLSYMAALIVLNRRYA